MEIIKLKQAEKFISNLNDEDFERTQTILEKLSETQNGKIPKITEKLVNSKVYYLRFQSASKWIRIFFGFHNGKILLLDGFLKKSNKPSIAYIKHAEELYMNFRTI